MITLESWILSYLANALWQLPLLFSIGWLAARLIRPVGPAAEHRVWVTVLLAQVLLPAASVASLAASAFLRIRHRFVFLWPHRLHRGDGIVTVIMGPGNPLGSLPLPRLPLALLTAAYGMVCLWFVARFAWRCFDLEAIRREATALPQTAEAAQYCAAAATQLGLDGISVGASTRVFSPVVLGLRRRTILVPANMLPRLTADDLDAVIAHECAHLVRNDFLRNLLYEALAIPVAWHPLLWATRVRLTETREMICDRLASAGSGRKQYARSLLRLATVLIDRTPVTTSHAIGIFDAHTFERRIMRLAEKPIEPGGARRAALAVACAVLGLAACGSAFALRVHVNTLNFVAAADEKPAKSVHVAPGVMAGQKISGDIPAYPQEAKDQRVQGTVVLDATIDKDGNVAELSVVSGPQMLRQSSLDAVRTWVYKPFLLNGDPVEVKTQISVVYTLADDRK